MESLTEPARRPSGGLKKYLKHVNPGLSAVTSINKRYFILLEITEITNGFVLLILEDLRLNKSPFSIK